MDKVYKVLILLILAVATTANGVAASVSPPVTEVATGFHSMGLLDSDRNEKLPYTVTYDYYDNAHTIIKDALVNVFDSNAEQVGHVEIQMDESRRCTRVDVLPCLPRHFFRDDAASCALVVEVDYTNSLGTEVTCVRVYDIATASLLEEYNAKYVDYRPGDSPRLILRSTVEEEDEEGNLLDTLYEFIVLEPARGLALKPRFSWDPRVSTSLTKHSEEFGNVLMFTPRGGRAAFAIAHYEWPYIDPESEADYTRLPTPLEGNHFVVELYDEDYEPVDTLSLPVEQRSDYFYTKYALGGFLGGDDLCEDVYSDGYKLLITKNYSGYEEGDDTSYGIVIYDASGRQVTTLADEVTSWRELRPVRGERQVSFLKEYYRKTSEYLMVDLSTAEQVGCFPETLDGMTLGNCFDRWPTADGYRYLFDIETCTVDGNGTVTARMGWYDTDATPLRYDEFTLGEGFHTFTSNVEADCLSPFTFNTDAYFEYLGVATMTDTLGNIHTPLVLVNDRGDVLMQLDAPDFHSQILDYGMLNDSTLYACFDRDTTPLPYGQLVTVKLPLTTFEEGGEGTPANPYRVSTAGQLALAARYPDAAFRLVGDVDMSIAGDTWEPIPEFRGILRGDGYCIKDLTLRCSDTLAGLFANLDGASVTGVHLTDFNIFAPGARKVGALAGAATGNSYVSGCSAMCLDASAGVSATAGGLIGECSGKARVEACAAVGSINGGSRLGGIVGMASNGTTISNCHADMTLAEADTIGGIVGTGNGVIERCVAHGEIAGELQGGIVGCYTGEKDGAVHHNVTANGSVAGIVFKANALVDNYVQPEATQEWLQALGYQFGNHQLAPWAMWMERPRMHYEHVLLRSFGFTDSKLAVSGNEPFAVAVDFDDYAPEHISVRYSGPCEVTDTVVGNGYIIYTFSPLGNGTLTLQTFTVDGLHDECIVTVTDYVGLNNLQVANSLSYDGYAVTAAENVEITIYDLAGLAVARGVGSVDVSALKAGVYIARAGNMTLKLMI